MNTQITLVCILTSNHQHNRTPQIPRVPKQIQTDDLTPALQSVQTWGDYCVLAYIVEKQSHGTHTHTHTQGSNMHGTITVHVHVHSRGIWRQGVSTTI